MGGNGYNHSIPGKYVPADEIGFTVIRIDPQGCQAIATGLIHVINRDALEPQVNPYKGCGLGNGYGPSLTSHFDRVNELEGSKHHSTAQVTMRSDESGGKMVGKRGPVVFASDDGKTVRGNEASNGYDHIYEGTYRGPNRIEFVVTRIDPSRCKTIGNGRWELTSATHAEVFFEGWNGCGVITGPVHAEVDKATELRPAPTDVGTFSAAPNARRDAPNKGASQTYIVDISKVQLIAPLRAAYEALGSSD